MQNFIRKLWRNNSLTIVMILLFLVFLFGQSVTGHRQYNQDQQEHQESSLTYGQYLKSSHFVEAVFENWESEFLQMSMYVLLTAFLVQKGSSESRDPAADPSRKYLTAASPKAARWKGFKLKIYENSLFLTLFLLFILAFTLHAAGGARNACQQAMAHGGECYSTVAYTRTSEFWFESFQNWQSEFLAVASLIILSIYLRQKNSPESKSVSDPHSKTG